MLTKSSVFDGKFFRWAVKKSVPYALLSAVILYCITLIIFLSASGFILADSTLAHYPTALVGIAGNVAMYILPLVFGIGIFSFLHKKNSSDFILSVPVKRSAIIITGFVASAMMIFIILLTNTLLTALCISITSSKQIISVAFESYLTSFIYDFIGSLQMLAITVFCATLTGTEAAQTVLSFVVALLPAYIVNYIQIPFCTSYSTILNGSLTYDGNIASFMMLPDIVSAPMTMIFNELIHDEISEFYGSYSYFASMKSYFFSLLLTVIFLVAAIFIFKKYKAETCGNAFAYKGITVFAYSGVLFPFTTMLFLFVFNNEISDLLFFIFMLMIFVGFTVMCLVLNRGFSGYGKALIVLVCSCIVFAGVAEIDTVNIEREETQKSISYRDISSVTLYIKPVNLLQFDEKNVSKTYVKVRIDDEKLLSMLRNEATGGRQFFDIVYNDGTAVTLCARLPQQFIDSVYDYIDSNTDIKRKLIISGGNNGYVNAFTVLSSQYYSYNNTTTVISDKQSVISMIDEYECSLLETPMAELTEAANNYFQYIGSYSENEFYYSYTSEQYAPFIANGSVSLYVPVLKYYNNSYCICYIPLESDSTHFESAVEDIQKNAFDTLERMNENDIYNYHAIVGGAFTVDDEQYINLIDVVKAMSYTIPEELYEAMKQAASEPLPESNNILVYFDSTDDYQNMVFMNIDRDIAPLFDAYYEKAKNELFKDTTSLYSRFGMIVDGETYDETGVFYPGNNILKNPETVKDEFISRFDEIKKLNCTKYSSETVPSELFSVMLSNNFFSSRDDFYNYGTDTLRFSYCVDSSFEGTVGQINDIIDKKMSQIATDRIAFATVDEIKVLDKDDIDYIVNLLKMTYFDAIAEDIYDDIKVYGEYEDGIEIACDYSYKEVFPIFSNVSFYDSESRLVYSDSVPFTSRLYEILYSEDAEG